MSIEQGTKVVVVSGGPTFRNNDYHSFNIGNIVTATGRVYDFNPEWELFRNDEGETTWLKAKHYEIVKQSKVVDKPLPSKVVYVVMKDGELWYNTEDRETAREVKAALGGKAKGAAIFAYSATKEIR
jgi:hypothetical protein